MGKTRADYAHDVLFAAAGVNGEPHVGALWAIQGWMIAESGHEPCTGQSGKGAAYNPLNTTLRMPGSTPYNAVPVQNYTSYDQGVKAITETLSASSYARLIAAMKPVADPHQTAVNVLWELVGSPWGTAGRDAYNGLADFLASPSTYNQIGVGP